MTTLAAAAAGTRMGGPMHRRLDGGRRRNTPGRTRPPPPPREVGGLGYYGDFYRGRGDDDLGKNDDTNTLEALYKSSLGVVTRLLDAGSRRLDRERPDHQSQHLRVLEDDLIDWTSTVRPSLIRLTLSEPPPLSRVDDYYGHGHGHSDHHELMEKELRDEGMRYSIRFVEALCTFARRDDDSSGDGGFDLTGVMDALDSTLVDLGYMPPADVAEDDDKEGTGGRGRGRRLEALDTFLRAAGGGGGDDGGEASSSLVAWYRDAMSSPREDVEDDHTRRSGKRAKLSRHRHLRRDYGHGHDHDDEEDADENREREERRMIRMGAMLSLPWVLAHGHHRVREDDDDTTTSPPKGPESSSSGVTASSRKRKAPAHTPSRMAGRNRGNRGRDDRKKKWRSELLYVLSHFVAVYHRRHRSPNVVEGTSYRQLVVPLTRTFRDLLGLSASDCDVALACHALDSLTTAATTAKDSGEGAGSFNGGGCGGVTPELALGEVLRPGVISELSSHVRPPHGGIVGDRDRLRIHGRHVALCSVARCLLGAMGAASASASASASAGRCAMELWRACGMDASSLLSRRRRGVVGAPSSSSSSSSRPAPRRRLHRSLAAAAPPSDRDDETLWLVVRTELCILLSAGRTEEACLLANLASRGDSVDDGNAMTTKMTPAADDLGRESWGRIFEAVSSGAAATARRYKDGDGSGCEEATLASLQDMLHVFPIGPVGQRLLLERLNADMDAAGQDGKPQLVANIQKLMYCFLVARTDPISAFSSAFDIDWWKLSLAAGDKDFDVTGESLAFLLNVGDGATGAAGHPVEDGETPFHEGSEDQMPSAPAGFAPPLEVAGDEVRVVTSEEKSAVEKDVHSKTVSEEAPHALTEREMDAAKSRRAVTPIDAVAKKKSAAAAALEMRQPMGDLQSKDITVGEQMDNAAQPEQTRSTRIGDSVEGNRLRKARREEADDFGDAMGVDDRVSHADALEGTAKRKKDGVKERGEDEALEHIAYAQKNRGEHPKRLEDTPQRNIEAQAIVETAPEVIRIRDKRSAHENLNQDEEEDEVEVLVVGENVEEDVEAEVQVAEEDVGEEEVEMEAKKDDVNDDVYEEEEDEKESVDVDSGTEDGSDASSLQDEGDYIEKSGSSDGSQPSGVGSESHLGDEEDDDESVVVIDDDEDAEEPSKGMVDEEADGEAMSVGSRVSDASVASASARSSPAGEASPRSRDECSEAEDDETIDEEAAEEEVDLSGTKVQEQRVFSSEQSNLEQHRFEEVGGVATGETKQEAAVAEARLEEGIRKEKELVTEANVEEEYLAKLQSAEDEGEMYVEGEREEEERLEMLREEGEERAAAEKKMLEQQRRDEGKRLAKLQEQEERRERVVAEKARLEEERRKEERRKEERRKEEQRAAAEKAEEKRLAELKLKEEERKRTEKARLEQEEQERRERLRAEAEERERAAAEHARLEQQRRDEQERLARLKEQERAAAERARLEDERRKEEERAAAEKAEKERLAELKLEEQKRKLAEEARLEQKRREQEERLAAEKAEEERLAQLREKEKEKQRRVAAEQEKLEQNRPEEEEQVAATKAEAERLKVEAERLATWRDQNVAKGQMASKQARLVHKHHKEEKDLAAGGAEEEDLSKFFEQHERRERAAAETATMEEKLAGEKEHIAAEKMEEERFAKLKEHEELQERKAAEQARIQEERATEDEPLAAEKAHEWAQEGDMGETTHGSLDQGRGEEGAEFERIAKKEEEVRIALARAKAEEFRKKAEASRLASATKKAKEVDRRKGTEDDDRKVAAHKTPKGKRQRDERDGSKRGHTSKDPDVGAVAKASSPLEVLSPKSTRMSGPSPQSAGSSLRSTPGIIGTSITFDNSGLASERLSLGTLGTTTSMSVVAPPVSTSADDEGGIVMKPRDTATIRQPSESVEEGTSNALSLSTLNAMKVAELRQECEKRGLDTTGHKADLQHRLREEIHAGQTVSSFSSMRYVDLREECKRLGLASTGHKADLVARLEANSSLARDAGPRKTLQEDGPVAPSVSSFSSMRYVDLREECKRRGLASTGHKADLVARLEKAFSDAGKADSMKLQEDTSVAESVASFSSKKVVDLRNDCRRLGLDSTGNKSDLIARLEANPVAHEDSPAAKSVSSFSSMKYEDARKECRRRGLDTRGHKADLIARLEASSSVAHTIDLKEELQEDSSVAQSVASFSTKTVADLRKDCERLGMDSTGTKSELIARLEENTSVAQSVSSLNSIKVSELRGLCARRGLDSTGRKADLVERMQEYSSAAQSHLDYDSMTLAELQEEYRYIGLDDHAFTSKKVSKADLVASLEEHVAKQPHARKGNPKGAAKPPLPPSSLRLEKKRRVQTSSTPSAAAVKRLRSSSDADSTGNQGHRDQKARPPLPPSSTGKAKTSKSVKSRGTPSSAGTVRTTRSSVRTTRSRTSK